MLDSRLSSIDAAFLYLERPEIPLHIAGLCVFDGEIPFARFVRCIDSRLHLLPRYRQVVVDPPFHLGCPVWEDDLHFDIHRHIVRDQLPSPGGRAELEALAGRVLSQVLDRRKPLWDLHVIDGLEGGRGAVLLRVHHALADGVAGASMVKVMLDSSRDMPQIRKRPFRPAAAPPPNRSMIDALAGAIRSSIENLIGAEAVLLDFSHALVETGAQDALEKLAALAPELAASSERFVFNKPCSGERKFCWTEFPFAGVQEVREAAGGTVNDVILTIVARAVSNYVREHGDPVAGRFLRVVCPVNVRQDHGESLGNRITFLPVALPLDIEKPVALLHAVAERTAIMKGARAAHLVALISKWLGAAPPPLQALFWQTIPQLPLPVPLLHMICTNVPGSPDPLYAVGRQMIACYPHVPTGYELGVNVAFQSYAGTVCCGLTADAAVVPDVGRLRDLLQHSFADLVRAATRRREPKRPPRRKRSADGPGLEDEPRPTSPPPEPPLQSAAAAAD